jgi:hypothetical protein
MSHNRAGALARQLLRAQLRVKVMAGVVIVTLVALVAFDIGAVATMRRYLLAQTDNNLQGALTLTLPRLATITGQRPQSKQSPATFRNKSKPVALPGAFDMDFLPLHGAPVTLQVAANGTAVGANWKLSAVAAKVAARPGPHVLAGPGGRAQLRVGPWSPAPAWTRSMRPSSRSSSSSSGVRSPWCCSSGSASSSCCAAGCARSRRWPRRPTGSPPATSPTG